MPKAHKPRKQSNVKDHENPEASWKMIQKRFNEETGEGKRIEALQMRVHRRQQEGVIWSNDQEQVLNEIVQQETKKFWKNVSSSIQARIGSLMTMQPYLVDGELLVGDGLSDFRGFGGEGGLFLGEVDEGLLQDSPGELLSEFPGLQTNERESFGR
ncbi:hypothetical protein BGX38DRAFT_1144703 [Terfezia claveryi]|nr:hypothetical protein BGX38DRAFT_1144703 [Terfezia claveryi]